MARVRTRSSRAGIDPPSPPIAIKRGTSKECVLHFLIFLSPLVRCKARDGLSTGWTAVTGDVIRRSLSYDTRTSTSLSRLNSVLSKGYLPPLRLCTPPPGSNISLRISMSYCNSGPMVIPFLSHFNQRTRCSNSINTFGTRVSLYRSSIVIYPCEHN